MKEYIVNEEVQNLRLDKAISILNTEISRTMIQKLLQEEKIFVNNKKEKPSYKTKLNDIIKIQEIEIKELNIICKLIFLY